MQEMERKYPLDWVKMWKKFCSFIAISAFTSAFVIIGIWVWLLEFRLSDVPWTSIVGILIIGLFVGFLIMLAVTYSLRSLSVTINKRVLIGKDIWGRGRKISMDDIHSIERYYNHGLSGYLVYGRRNEKIFIPDQLENIADLLDRITPPSVGGRFTA